MPQHPEPDPDRKRHGARTHHERDRIVAAVEDIIASGALGQSDRRARLLRYLVQHECDGNGARIKAFSIAVDVFDRDQDFDPNSDSIVRTEVARLRDALKLFYADPDRSDLVVIDIPKGTYRPTFTDVSPARTGHRTGRIAAWAGLAGLAMAALIYAISVAFPRPAPPGDTAQPGAPVDVVRVSVLPFDSDGDHPELDEIAFGLFSELAMDLSAYPWIAVVSPQSARDETADYVLRNDLLWSGDRLLSNAQLLTVPDSRLVWSKSFTASTTLMDVRRVQDSITSGIIASLGSARGIAPDLVRVQNANRPKSDLDAFICFLGTYQYIETRSVDEHLKLRNCLEDVVQRYPEFGVASATLGIVYMDEARFGFNPRRGRDPWEEARQAVETGLQFAPLRAPALHAGFLLALHAPDRDLDAASRHGRRLAELFPRHPQTLALIGTQMAMVLGHWDTGLDMLAQARSLEPAPSSAFFVADGFHAAMGTDDAAAIAAAQPLTNTTSGPELLIRYLAASRQAARSEMQDLRALLARQGMATPDELSAFVTGLGLHQALTESLLLQLDAAVALESQATP